MMKRPVEPQWRPPFDLSWAAFTRLEVMSLTADASGSVVLSVGRGRDLGLWDVATGLRVATLQVPAKVLSRYDPFYCGALSTGADWALIGTLKGRAILYDLKSGAAPIVGETGLKGVCSVALRPDGRRAILGGGAGELVLWSTQTRETIWRFIGHEYQTRAVSPDADWRRMVSLGYFGTLRTWDLDAGTCLSTRRTSLFVYDADLRLEVGRGAVASRDVFGPRAPGIREAVVCLDLESGEPSGEWHASRRPRSAVALSPDGQWLASGGRDGVVRVWAHDQHRAFILARTRSWITACTFVNLETIVVGDGNGDVTFLRIPAKARRTLSNDRHRNDPAT